MADETKLHNISASGIVLCSQQVQGKRPDKMYPGSLLVSSSGFVRNWKSREEGKGYCRPSNRPKYSVVQLELLHKNCIESQHNLMYHYGVGFE